MSKQIKQLEMDALRKTFGEVRDLVVLTVNGLSCQADNQLRLSLRKKNIRLQMVKNSLARRVFDGLGISLPKESPYWAGTTTLAWGAGSLAELSRDLESELKALVTKNAKLKDKVKVKGAISDGQEVTFDRALKMPTRAEAIANVIALALAPASRLVSQIQAPGASLASQVKTISEKKPEESAPAAAEPAAPTQGPT
jgi:large subunit ribosomal protein L10